MKSVVLFFSIVICFSFGAKAQDMFKKAAASNSSGDTEIKNLTSSIMEKLVPALGLSDTQKHETAKAINGFLRQKSRFLPIKEMDPVGYASNQDNLFDSLKSKLEKILQDQQMQKFLGLKPKTEESTDVLSNLFY